jgi:branched-chain amino acid transport system substrate-binding protein
MEGFFKSMRSITKTHIIIVIIAVIVVIAVIYYLTLPSQSTPTEKDSIVIGFSMSLSGKYMRTGEYSLEAIRTWVENVNKGGGVYVDEYGKKLKVSPIWYDDKSNKETAIRLYEKLILDDKIDMALCPYSSALTFATTPITDKYEIVTFSHGGASNAIFERGLKYVVQVITPTTGYIADIVEMASTLDPKPETVAVIYENTEFPKSCAKAATDKAEELGMEVVLDEGYPKGVTDLSALLTKIKSKNPDMVMGGGYLPDGLLIVRQMKELDVNVKLIALLVAPPMPDFVNALEEDAEYVFGPTQWERGVKYEIDYGPTGEEFVSMIREKWGHYPEYHHAEAYAACLVLQKAIEESGTLDSDKIRVTVNNLDFTTFFGRFKIDSETGLQTGHKMVIIQIQNGERRVVAPSEVAEVPVIYPMPAWSERV